MTRRPYKARTTTGAQARVRQLEKLVTWYEQHCRKLEGMLDQAHHEANLEANLLAKLAAKGPCFYNPLVVWEVEALRDRRLAAMGLRPNGTPLNPEK